MKNIASIITAFFILFFLSSFANAQTDKLDDLASCSCVVIGNGAVDFHIGNDQSFDDAANIAYSAYLSEVFAGGYGKSDVLVADQILGVNVDKIISAYNSENFTADVYLLAYASQWRTGS